MDATTPRHARRRRARVESTNATQTPTSPRSAASSSLHSKVLPQELFVMEDLAIAEAEDGAPDEIDVNPIAASVAALGRNVDRLEHEWRAYEEAPTPPHAEPSRAQYFSSLA